MLPMPKNAPIPDSAHAADYIASLPYVSRETFARLEQFVALLLKWNKAINLIGKATEADIWQRHILDSVQLFPLLKQDARLLTDFGSGAGFPGIILALLGAPHVVLVESDQRKCAFLSEAGRLSTSKVTVHNARIEMLTPWKSDVITARALAPLGKLLELTYPFASPATQFLFLKGVNTSSELSEAEEKWHLEKHLHSSITAENSWIVELHTVTPTEKS
jgi:16S rRNA (guanine527-N7)-methyltransferase